MTRRGWSRKDSLDAMKSAHSFEEFCSIIVHDLRNRVNGVRAGVDIIADNFSELSEDERAQVISDMKNGTSDVFSMLDAMLDYAQFVGKIDFPRS